MNQLIQYSTGEPAQVGVYACRVGDVQNPHSDLPRDAFLMRSEGKWWYLGSDAQFRGEVYGWVGPLQRRITTSKVAR